MITSFKIANIITHITFIAIIIIAIFFTVGIKIENSVVKREISYLIKKNLDPLSQIYPDIITQKNNFVAKMGAQEDSPNTLKEINDHNKALIMEAVKYMLILFIIALITILLIAWKFSRLSDGKVLSYTQFLVKLIKYNILTLMFVAATYIGFIFFIGKEYIYVDSNKINETVIRNLIQIRGPVTSKQEDAKVIQQIVVDKGNPTL